MTEADTKESSTLFSGALIVIIATVMQLGLSFVDRLLLARYLGSGPYGLLALLISVVNTAGLLSLLGVNMGIGRMLPRASKYTERESLVTSAVVTGVFVSIIISVGIILTSNQVASVIFGSQEQSWLAILVGICIPFIAFSRVIIGIAQGREDAIPKALFENILPPLIRAFAAIFVVTLGFDVVFASVGYTISFVVPGIAALIYLIKSNIPFSFRFEYHRDLLAFSLPLVISLGMIQILQYIDTILLGIFKSIQVVGLYNVVYPLSRLLAISLTAFGFILLPIISRIDSEGAQNRAQFIYKIGSKWVFFTTAPLFFALGLYPEAVIQLTFGPEYVETSNVLVLLSIGWLIHSSVGPAGKVLVSYGRSRLVMLDNMFSAATNVVLNVLLIPIFGIWGAAVSTVISYSVMNMLFITQLYRSHSLQPFSWGLLRVSIVSIPAAFLISILANEYLASSILTLFIGLSTSTVLHLILVFYIGGITSYEWDAIDKFYKKISSSIYKVLDN